MEFLLEFALPLPPADIVLETFLSLQFEPATRDTAHHNPSFSNLQSVTACKSWGKMKKKTKKAKC
jgi:hypothetical protein